MKMNNTKPHVALTLISLLFISNFSMAKAKSVGKEKGSNLNRKTSMVSSNMNFQSLSDILRKSRLASSDLSIAVGDLANEKMNFSVNEGAALIPASITKIITAGAILHRLPPGTKFKTQLLSDAQIDKGQLNGNLYFKGGGDPSFVSENLWYLVNIFVRNGISKINGDIIVDDSIFDQSRFDESRQKERVDRAYDAPTGGLSFNWNSVNIFIRPGKAVGDPALVFADPENSYITIKGGVKTLSRGSENRINIDRIDNDKSQQDIIHVSGGIALDSKETVVFKNITKPDLWAGANLKSFLLQRGILVEGQIVSGKTPERANILAESESKPIEHILADMNKFSNNYVAEMLTKNLGLSLGEPGTIEKGVKLINEYMASLGINKKEYEIYNPSGLTRKNKITSRAMLHVLKDLQREFKYNPEFISSLPIAGVDGTLKKRMKSTKGERWVRAKTGYLDRVVTLAGYAGRENGEVIPFVFIYNGSVDEAKVRAVFDQMATALVE